MVHFFCPRCWVSFTEDVEICPRCRLKVREFWRSKDYVEQLIVALRHPVATIPLQAAEILGNKGDARAVEPLIAVVNNTTRDVFLLKEAVVALGRIGGERARSFLATLSGHPTRMIREAVSAALSRERQGQSISLNRPAERSRL